MSNSNIDSSPLKHPEKTSLSKEKLSPIDKARLNPNSLRMALNANCYQCMGEDADPGWQKRVGECYLDNCVLWPHRPYQHHLNEDK